MIIIIFYYNIIEILFIIYPTVLDIIVNFYYVMIPKDNCWPIYDPTYCEFLILFHYNFRFWAERRMYWFFNDLCFFLHNKILRFSTLNIVLDYKLDLIDTLKRSIYDYKKVRNSDLKQFVEPESFFLLYARYFIVFVNSFLPLEVLKNIKFSRIGKTVLDSSRILYNW